MVSRAVKKIPEPAKLYPKTLVISREDNLSFRTRELLFSHGVQSSQVCSLEEASRRTTLATEFCVVLLEIKHPLLSTLEEGDFLQVQKILLEAQGVLWVTNGGGSNTASPDYMMINGLAKTVRTERNNYKFATLALEDLEHNIGQSAGLISSIYEKIASATLNDYESDYIERNGLVHIVRLVEANKINQAILAKARPQVTQIQGFGKGPPLRLQVASPGLLDSLQFLEDSDFERPLEPFDVQIEVKAIGVNFMDCLIALGRINQNTIGAECAGIVTRTGPRSHLCPGDRVAACTLDTYKTYARTHSDCVVKIPDAMSYVEAASIPAVFTTAYHALCEVARIRKGETILIHAGAGGTGQAAIQIAKHVGAEIFATVGSNGKRDFLVERYGISVNHIFYSRDTSFAFELMKATNGVGVDVVLNSLSGNGLVASWECIAPYGRFVEIGKADIHSHGNLAMYPFAKNCSFAAVDLAAMMTERPAQIQKCLSASMTLITQGMLQIIQPIHVYEISEVEAAFRYLQSGKNTGKAVIEVKKDAEVLTVLDTKPSYRLNANGTYVIAGGLGGLGRGIARWMARLGAKNLVLLSRSGPTSEEAIKLINELKSQGVKVFAPPCNIASSETLSEALRKIAETMPPIKGCIQSSMVLRDVVFENMSFSDWNICTSPKVQGSWNLHKLLPSKMDFFILLSSIAGILGSGGQANYAAGNTYIDALARHRIMQKEKGVTLNLGWMKSAGIVSENSFLQKLFETSGFLIPISQDELFCTLEYYCDPQLPFPTTSNFQAVLGLETPANVLAKGGDQPEWMSRATFRAMHQIRSSQESSFDEKESKMGIGMLFANAHSLAEAGEIVLQSLVKKLSKALAIPPEEIDTNRPLHTYGVDSLLAVELRNWFTTEMGADVSIFDITGGSSFMAVSLIVAAKSQYRQSSWGGNTDLKEN